MTKNYDNKEKRFVTFAKEQPGHAEKANKKHQKRKSCSSFTPKYVV